MLPRLGLFRLGGRGLSVGGTTSIQLWVFATQAFGIGVARCPGQIHVKKGIDFMQNEDLARRVKDQHVVAVFGAPAALIRVALVIVKEGQIVGISFLGCSGRRF